MVQKLKSIAEQLTELHEFQQTEGFTEEWPDRFVVDMWSRYEKNKTTITFSDRQVAKINELWMEYCK